MSAAMNTAAARRYADVGIRTIPISGSKMPPKGLAWSKWSDADPLNVDELVGLHDRNDCEGLAVLTGVDDLLILDFDQKYFRPQPEQSKLILHAWSDAMYAIDPDFDLTTHCVAETPSGGHHIYLRVPGVKLNNAKLAMRPAYADELEPDESGVLPDPTSRPAVLIETRGWHGYACAVPTPGYTWVIGSPATVQTITPDKWGDYVAAAELLDTMPPPPPRVMPTVRAPRHDATTDGVRPGDDYNAKVTPPELLEKAGWTFAFESGGRIYMKRPGGTDARQSGNYHVGHGLFRCHSSSTNLPTDESLSSFALYAHLHHHGDFAAAAKDLADQGYGEKGKRISTPTLGPPATQHQQPATAPPPVSDDVVDAGGDVDVDYVLSIYDDKAGRYLPLGALGMIGAFSGRAKSGKTTALAALAASALSGRTALNFSATLPPNRPDVIWIDTEQPKIYARRTQRRILGLAGADLKRGHPNLTLYSHRSYSVPERIIRLKAIALKHKDTCGLLVIDGTMDLVDNPNEYEPARELAELLMQMTDAYGFMVICVQHLANTTGQMLGHVGQALSRKCDFTINVDPGGESGIREVTCNLTRERPFSDWHWRFDDQGRPDLCGSDGARMISTPPSRTPVAPPPKLQSAVTTEEDIPF